MILGTPEKTTGFLIPSRLHALRKKTHVALIHHTELGLHSKAGERGDAGGAPDSAAPCRGAARSKVYVFARLD